MIKIFRVEINNKGFKKLEKGALFFTSKKLAQKAMDMFDADFVGKDKIEWKCTFVQVHDNEQEIIEQVKGVRK